MKKIYEIMVEKRHVNNLGKLLSRNESLILAYPNSENIFERMLVFILKSYFCVINKIKSKNEQTLRDRPISG